MVSHALIYLTAVALAQLSSLVLLPIVTRFLDPVAYGEYALVLATTGLIGTFGSSWVRNVAMRLHFDYAADGRTGALFWTAALLQCAVMTGLLVIGYLAVQFVGDGVRAGTYVAGAASVLLADFYALSSNTLRAGRRAMAFGAAEFTGALLRVGGTWAGLLAGYRTPAMLFVFAALSVSLAALVARPGVRSLLAGRRAIDARAAAALVKLGLPSIPHAAGGWTMVMADRLLIAYFLDLGAVGVYSVAHGIAERAMTGLATGLYMMAWPVMLQTWTEQPARTPATIGRFLGAYVALSARPAVFLMLHSTLVLETLVSVEYLAAAPAVPCVVAGAWLIGLAGYFNRPLELRKEYGRLSRVTMAAAGTNLIMNLVLIPRMGVIGAAVSTACAGGVMLLASVVEGVRVQPPCVPWRLLAGVAAAVVVAALPTFVLESRFVAVVWFVSAYVVTVGLAWRYVDRKTGEP